MNDKSKQIIWVGQLTRLRALERDDLRYTHKWTNDPRNVEFDAHVFPISMAQEEEWFESRLRDPNRNVLVIEKSEDSRAIPHI